MAVVKGYTICLAQGPSHSECSINKVVTISGIVPSPSQVPPPAGSPPASPESALSSCLQAFSPTEGQGSPNPDPCQRLAHCFLEWQQGAERRKWLYV